MMNKLSLLGSAVALACFTGSAFAQNVAPNQSMDDATRQKVYDSAYQNLISEQHQCTSKPCGSAIPSDKVESIFNTAYVQETGKQPSYEDFLQWKYMSNYPSSVSTASDTHFPQASDVKVSKKSAAVREMPSTTSKEKKTETTTTKRNCGEKETK